MLESHFVVSQAFDRMPLNPIYNNTPMWFLFVLFMINIIYYAFVRFLPRWSVIVLSLLLGGVGYWIASHGYVLEPYLDIAFVAMPFFMLGNEASKLGVINYRPPLFSTLALVAATVLWVYFDTPVINMLKRNYPSPLLLFGMTTMVIFSLFFACQQVKRPVPIISYFGRYSLIVLGTHYFVIGVLRLIVQKFLGIDDKTIVWLSILVVTMAIEIPVIYLLIRYFPRFTAQKELFHDDWRIKSSGEKKDNI